ncbi:PTS sugar transporter subunit IIA [bacterium]|nr:PTS sugar transporter subunit IIA [bacterium]
MGILREYLRDELILTQITLDDSPSAIHLLAQAAEPWSGVSVEILEKAVMVREQHGTTGVGKRVAIPHGRMKGLDDVLLVIANSKNPIDFSSEDGEGVQLIFMLIVPEDDNLLYLKLLAKISLLCADKKTRELLINAHTAQEIITIIEEGE